MVIFFSAIYWFSYENTKSRALNFTGSTVAGVPHTFFAGAVSGAVSICPKQIVCLDLFSYFKPYSAKIFLYKPWRPKGFLAPAVTVGERRELWILPPFFSGLFFCL